MEEQNTQQVVFQGRIERGRRRFAIELVMQTILLGLDLEERALKLIRSHHTCYENCFAISHI